MHAARDEACEVRHVDHEIGADAVGDLAEAFEVPEPRIGRAAGDDQFRLHLLHTPFDLVHVDGVVVLAHRVVLRVEPFAGDVHGRAVRQVAAGREIEAHEGVARLQQRQKHRLVHLAAGVRLHVREIAAEQLLGPLDRQRFGDIDVLAAAIVAGARITLRVLVRHDRALRFQHGPADDVFRRDQLDLVLLAAELVPDRTCDLGIGLGERRRKEG